MDYLIIANLFLLLFLGLADNQMIAALLPVLMRSFRVGVGLAGMLVVVYSVAAAGAGFLFGSLSDRYGRRRFLWLGAGVFAAASWLASSSQSFSGLMAARVLTGLAAGTISTCSLAYAGDWFHYSVRGRAIGLISIAYFAAPVIGVPLGAVVADRYGWRRTFLLFALLAVCVGSLSLTLERDASAPRKFSGIESLRVFKLFLAQSDLVAAILVAFLVSGGLVGFITYIGEWLSSRFALTTRGIGWVFMLAGLVAIAGAPLGGALSDRWSKRSVSIAGNVLLALAVSFITLFSWGSLLLIVFGLAAFGAAFRQGPLTALMTEMVPSTRRGSFMALRNVSSQLGIGAAAFAGGILYQHYGYAAVTSLCAAMTAAVAVLLWTAIREPQGAEVKG